MLIAKRTFQHGSSDGGKQWGDDGDNALVGTLGNDVVHGGGGADTVTGFDGDDKLWGDDGDDMLDGGAGKDKLDGGAGDDILTGGDGRDTLTGGLGADTLTGGADRDRFVLGSLAEANGDHVTDYDAAGRDRLDIKWDRGFGIDDSASRSGDDTGSDDTGAHFAFIGSAAFTDAGQVRVEGADGTWTVSVNVDADLNADYTFTVTTNGGAELTARDFHF